MLRDGGGRAPVGGETNVDVGRYHFGHNDDDDNDKNIILLYIIIYNILYYVSTIDYYLFFIIIITIIVGTYAPHCRRRPVKRVLLLL